jgi:tetratricopeptide (TPR) repeat protein
MGVDSQRGSHCCRGVSDPSAVLRELGSTAQAHPNDAVAWYRWAVALARAGQRTQAVATARHALTQAGQAPVLVGLGKLLEILEQHTEAVVAYRRAAQHDPTLVDAHVCLASLLRRLDDPRAAVLTLRAAAARLPGSGPMSLELAEALLAVHQPDEAIMHAERARERSMPEEAVLRVFARARAVLGQLDAALAALRTLPELTEDDVEVAVSVARKLALGPGGAGAALAALEHARARAPSPEAQLALGIALSELGAHSPALEALRRAVAERPTSGEAQLALGQALSASGSSGEAVAALRAAIRALPRNARAHVALAEALGPSPESTQLWVRAAALAPDDEYAREGLSRALGQARARTATPRAVSNGGITSDLSIFSLPELLEFLGSQRATGTLLIHGPDGREGGLELFEGQISGARHAGGRRLSDVLVEEDLISRTDLLRALSGQVEHTTDAALLAGVLEAHLVQREALASVVKREIKVHLSVLVQWREGQAMFYRAPPSATARPEILVETRWALMDALRSYDELVRDSRDLPVTKVSSTPPGGPVARVGDPSTSVPYVPPPRSPAPRPTGPTAPPTSLQARHATPTRTPAPQVAAVRSPVPYVPPTRTPLPLHLPSPATPPPLPARAPSLGSPARPPPSPAPTRDDDPHDP